MTTFDARGYWEDRLGRDWSLQGVGFRRLGRAFNAWAYRLRAEVFRDVVAAHVPDLASRDVLDVGSGTGFYIDLWQRLGVRSVTGLDLTDAAVGRLRASFPDVPFRRGDISDDAGGLPPASFDVVSAMDVLFHIVDDSRFAAALKNVHDLLRPGGVFLWSDAYLHHREIRREHVVWRRLPDIERMLADAGLDVVRRTPMFVLMNDPMDSRSRLLRAGWYAGAGLIALVPPLGEPIGRILYRVDTRLVRTRSESPTTEIMVCRRRD